MESGILKLIVFAAVSGGLLFVSWKPLRVVRSHGFYRFFAWESILALILINIDSWFHDPFSLLQIVSWSFLCLSIVLLGLGYTQLRTAGKQDKRRKDKALLDFEKTTVLVTTGIFRYIRHPLYGSLLFLAWGAFLKELTLSSILLVLAATLFLAATAKADETECIRYFGASYQEYMSKTKMFVPYVF